jgi:hypothetical protein
MCLGKWSSPVEDELKKTILTEYKFVTGRISEAQEEVARLVPRMNSLTQLINIYGWTAEVERMEEGDDFKSHPEAAKTKGAKIAAVATKLFKENGNHWTRLTEIYLYLSENGIAIGGKNPNSTLSAHLSNSDRFEGDRAKGWRLKQEEASARDWYRATFNQRVRHCANSACSGEGE